MIQQFMKLSAVAGNPQLRQRVHAAHNSFNFLYKRISGENSLKQRNSEPPEFR
jgi:hypothetical protein